MFKKFVVFALFLMSSVLMSSFVAADNTMALLPTPTPTHSTGTLPDLSISGMHYTYNPAQLCYTNGDPIGINVGVMNSGTATTASFTVTLTVNGQNYSHTFNGIEAMQTRYIWLQTGTSTEAVSATADTNGQITESNEGNNILTAVPFTPQYFPCSQPPSNPAPSLPDLRLSEVVYGNAQGWMCQDAGQPLGVFVKVGNVGSVDAGAFTVLITLNEQTFTRSISGLVAGQSTGVWFPESGTSTEEVYVMVDSDNQVNEISEMNNGSNDVLPAPNTNPCIAPTPGAGSENLLQNGSFELNTNWAPHSLQTGDRRVCNTNRRLITTQGACAFQFSGSYNTARVLSQKVNISGSGSALELSGWVEAKQLEAGARISVVLRYADGTRQQLKFRPAEGSYGFTQFSVSKALTGRLTGATIKVIAAQTGGLVRFDDLSLKLK